MSAPTLKRMALDLLTGAVQLDETAEWLEAAAGVAEDAGTDMADAHKAVRQLRQDAQDRRRRAADLLLEVGDEDAPASPAAALLPAACVAAGNP